MPGKTLTTRQVADEIGVHPKTLNNWIESGRIEPPEIGGGRGCAYKWNESEIGNAKAIADRLSADLSLADSLIGSLLPGLDRFADRSRTLLNHEVIVLSTSGVRVVNSSLALDRIVNGHGPVIISKKPA